FLSFSTGSTGGRNWTLRWPHLLQNRPRGKTTESTFFEDAAGTEAGQPMSPVQAMSRPEVSPTFGDERRKFGTWVRTNNTSVHRSTQPSSSVSTPLVLCVHVHTSTRHRLCKLGSASRLESWALEAHVRGHLSSQERGVCIRRQYTTEEGRCQPHVWLGFSQIPDAMHPSMSDRLIPSHIVPQEMGYPMPSFISRLDLLVV
ncbi:unnamed protein product, partial [Protopolystoma xenopodis]